MGVIEIELLYYMLMFVLPGCAMYCFYLNRTLTFLNSDIKIFAAGTICIFQKNVLRTYDTFLSFETI